MHYPLPFLQQQLNNSIPYHTSNGFNSIAHRKSHSMDSQVMAANAKNNGLICIAVGGANQPSRNILNHL